MAAIKEFTCLAHGDFAAREARCPHGCTVAIAREFRTAPGTRSRKTKATDKALERLAASFGMTDISNRNGTVAGSKPPQQGPDLRPQWLPVAPGDNLEVGRGIVSREGSTGGANATAKELHTERMGDEPVATESVPLPIGDAFVTPSNPAGRLPPVRPNIIHNDNTSAADFKKAVARAQ